MKMIMFIVLVLLVLMIIISGCTELEIEMAGNDFVLGSARECYQAGTYCHISTQDGGVMYLNFSDVTGSFNYEVST